MSCKKYPNCVKPTDDETAKGNDETDNESDKTALLIPGRPSYDELGDPVNEGNEKKKDLNEL